MTIIEREIWSCLAFFGPCTVKTLQEKLKLRGIELSEQEIAETGCSLIKRQVIRAAKGFNESAFKV